MPRRGAARVVISRGARAPIEVHFFTDPGSGFQGDPVCLILFLQGIFFLALQKFSKVMLSKVESLKILM